MQPGRHPAGSAGPHASNDRPGSGDRVNRRWDLVVVGVIVNACLGTVYSWSVFRAPLEEALGLTASQSGLPYAVFLGAFAFAMPLGGSMIVRLGTRATLVAGGLLVGAGWITGGLIEGFLPLVLSYGLIGGVGVGLAYGVPLAVVGTWFPDRRGLAMGLTLAGFGVSPFVTALLAEILILSHGVQSAMVILGVGFIAVIGALSVFFVPRREVHADDAPRSAGKGSAPTDTVPRARNLSPVQMLRTREFYGLWSCYAFGTLAGLTAIGMTASFGQEVAGLRAPVAAAAVSVFGILNGGGRPVFGSLHDRLGTRTTIILSFVLIALAAGVSLLAGPGNPVPFFVGFGLFWLMLGGWLAIAPAATTRLYGPRDFARNYGIMYTAYGVGALIGGAVSGGLYERFGSYSPMFLFVLALSAIGIVVAVVLIKPRIP